MISNTCYAATRYFKVERTKRRRTLSLLDMFLQRSDCSLPHIIGQNDCGAILTLEIQFVVLVLPSRVRRDARREYGGPTTIFLSPTNCQFAMHFRHFVNFIEFSPFRYQKAFLSLYILFSQVQVSLAALFLLVKKFSHPLQSASYHLRTKFWCWRVSISRDLQPHPQKQYLA